MVGADAEAARRGARLSERHFGILRKRQVSEPRRPHVRRDGQERDRFRATTAPPATSLESSPLRNPRAFFKPLAMGAPDPLREIPVTPSRMIHFLDFSNEKMVAKAPDIAKKVDILLGNLEDAVPVERKEAAREGLITVGRDMDLGDTRCGRGSTRSSRRGCSTTSRGSSARSATSST